MFNCIIITIVYIVNNQSFNIVVYYSVYEFNIGYL